MSNQKSDFPVQDFDDSNWNGMQSYGTTDPSPGFDDGESYGGTVPPSGGWNTPNANGGESYGGTMPPSGGWNTPNASGGESYGGTMPPSGGWNISDAGETTPASWQRNQAPNRNGVQDYDVTTPAHAGPGSTMPSWPVQPGSGMTAPAREWLDPGAAKYTTWANQSPIPDFNGDSANRRSPVARPNPIYPVVGWLVCTKGVEKGRSYPIHPENNYVGRSSRMDICVSDDVISRENQFVISYVTRTRKFYASSSGGKNITELNDIPLSNTIEIHAHDRFVIDTAEFRFIPFCGEQFGWDDMDKQNG